MKTDKTIRMDEIKSRDYVRGGHRVTGTVRQHHHAEIVPGVSIKLHGVEKRYRRVQDENGFAKTVETTVCYARTFRIGDIAEYDSYNFSYYGRIVSIAAKTVSIVEEDRGAKLHRLDIHDFDLRNWDFDQAAADKHNSEEMMVV